MNLMNLLLAAQVRAAALLRSRVSTRPFGVGETESIMQFSRLGSLHCLCEGRHAEDFTGDRRIVCRACGNEIVPCDAELLNCVMSVGEILAQVRLVQSAGVRARNVDIPSSIRSVQQLHAYLDANHGRRGRKPPRRPNAPVSAAARVRVH